MADFNYTGGVRFAPDKVVDVTADKDGNPTKACNPITGVCLEGGGGDASVANLTIKNSTNKEIVMTAPAIKTIMGVEMISVYGISVLPGTTETYGILIYKDITEYPFAGEDVAGTVSGDIELIDKSGEGWLLITGDGEIDITAYTQL